MTGSLDVSGVGVAFGDRAVLEDVSLSVAAGGWTTVVGPNGAGKTTLLRAVMGLVEASGTVTIAGAEPGRDGRARVAALVPQIPVIPPGVRVVDYLLLGRTPHRGVFAGDTEHDLTVVADVMARLDLVGFGSRVLTTLSGGETQRVVLARALVAEPRLLLLDEPTSALDLGHQQDVLDLVDDLRRQGRITVLATLHDLTLAARYGDSVVILDQGRIADEGRPAAVLTEERIERHFGARVRVIEDADGPVIVPISRR